jgi:hypothetical protein
MTNSVDRWSNGRAGVRGGVSSTPRKLMTPDKVIAAQKPGLDVGGEGNAETSIFTRNGPRRVYTENPLFKAA